MHTRARRPRINHRHEAFHVDLLHMHNVYSSVRGQPGEHCSQNIRVDGIPVFLHAVHSMLGETACKFIPQTEVSSGCISYKKKKKVL